MKTLIGTKIPKEKSSNNVGTTSRDAPLEKTYYELIEEQINKYPHKDIFSDYNSGHFQYTRLDTHAKALGAGLFEILGRKCDSSYTVSSPITPEALVGQIAAPLAGKWFGAFDYHFKGEQLIKAIRAAQSGVLLFTKRTENIERMDDLYEVFEYLKKRNYLDNRYLDDKRVPLLRAIVQNTIEETPGVALHAAILNYSNTPSSRKFQLKWNDVSSLFVDGDFNTVALTQSNIINTGKFTGELLGIDHDDVILSTLPIYRAVGQSLGLGLALSRQAKLVFPADSMQPLVVLDALASYKATVMASTQSDWKKFLSGTVGANKKFKDLKKAIVVVDAHETVDGTLLNQISDFTGVKNVHVVRGNDLTSGAFSVDDQLLPHLEARVVDSSGKVVAPGSSGSIQLKGYNVFSRYLHNEELTKKTIQDGWLSTNLNGKASSEGSVKVDL